MKRLIFTSLLALAFATAKGQRMSDGVVLDTMPSVQYIEVYGYNKSLKIIDKDVVPIVDYGQRVRMKKGAYVVGDDGKALEFESVIGVLNYLYSKGWELMNSFDVNDGTGGTVYHHVMQRKK